MNEADTCREYVVPGLKSAGWTDDQILPQFFFRHRKQFVNIDDLTTYKRCRVQLNARGGVLRDEVSGSEIKTKQQQIWQADDFLVAEIDAKVGGFGIVQKHLAGAVVSSHYFLFEINNSLLDAKYLEFYLRTPDFLEQVTAKGSTNYAAIRPDHVLGYTLPLPSLTTQRRIVVQIEALAGKIAEARSLRASTIEDAKAEERLLLDQHWKSLAAHYGVMRLEQVCELITDGDHNTPKFCESGVSFIFVGNVSSGTLHFTGAKFVASDYYAMLSPPRKPRRGDILYSAVGAKLGVPAIVDTDRPFCFQRHIALIRPNAERVLPAYMWYMLRSDIVFRIENLSIDNFRCFEHVNVWIGYIMLRGRLEEGITLLNRIFPEDIRVTASSISRKEPQFLMRETSLPFAALSDGYRGFVGWIGDLLYQLCRVTSPAQKLTDVHGVVMVDELDLLLHPAWQRTVVSTLATTFPNLQFFFTSHSPIVAGTLEAANIFVTEPATESGAITVQPGKESVHGLSADQILTSAYFDLPTPRAPDAVNQMKSLARSAWEGDAQASREFLRRLTEGFEAATLLKATICWHITC